MAKTKKRLTNLTLTKKRNITFGHYIFINRNEVRYLLNVVNYVVYL